jgi:hypothetical protein
VGKPRVTTLDAVRAGSSTVRRGAIGRRMTRVANDPSAKNTYIVETDWDMNTHLSTEGYSEWLLTKGLTDVDGDSLFARYRDERLMAHYAGSEPLQWLTNQGIAWHDGKGVKDAQDRLGDFVGFTVVIGSDEGAEAFERRWL